MTTSAQAVQARMEQWKNAFEQKNVEAIMTFYDGASFTAFDLMPPIEFRGEGRWRANWIDFFAAFEGSPTLEFAEMEIVADDALAVVRLLNRLSGTMYGNPIDTWVRQTNCFRLRGGEWVMFHDHVSVPTDFSTGRSLLELSPVPATELSVDDSATGRA